MRSLFPFRALVLLILTISFWNCTPQKDYQLDLLINNGSLYDGVSPVQETIDIGIVGDSIAFIGQKETISFETKQTIEASGYIVAGTVAHPRKFGSFPKKIREYVIEKKILSLREMIERTTSLTAQTFGIDRRGIIKEGYFADLIIFKPEEIKDKATFEKPTELAEGMHYVIVNGQVTIDKGKYNGTLAGHAIKRANN